MRIKESFISTWHDDETKRDFVYRLFPFLEKTDAGRQVLLEMAQDLSTQTTFPDLENWEDSVEKKTRAANAVRALHTYLRRQREEVQSEREQAAVRKRAQDLRVQQSKQRADLDRLRERLDQMASRLGTQEAGYDFEKWFYDLVGYFELIARPPYVHAGRQIDGTITCEGTTYLVELKFTAVQAAGPDVDVFYKKVTDKADNTMGIMVAIAGYSTVAIQSASIPRTPLLLLDHGHLYALLAGTLSLPDLIGRVRRHSSQTSSAYISAADM